VCLYWIVPISRGFSVVIVKQVAESLLPDHRAIRSRIVGRLKERTTKTLMRALCMVMRHVFANPFSQVRLTRREYTVEALLFN